MVTELELLRALSKHYYFYDSEMIYENMNFKFYFIFATSRFCVKALEYLII